MKLKKCILLVAILAIAIILYSSDSMASYNTYDLEIESPDEGDLWHTGIQVLVKWTAYATYSGYLPAPGTVHYLIKLDDNTITYDYYTYIVKDPQVPGFFIMKGSFRWLVPGNTYYRNPNATLTVYSGNQDCPNCYDLDGIRSVSIRLKMWYDPIPIPFVNVPPLPMLGADNVTESPKGNFLSGPYPNPFNPQTTICFGLKEAATVSMKIYNVEGRLVKTLHNCSFMQAGEYQESWNGLDDYSAKVPSGVYFLRINASNGFSKTQKMILLQ